MGPDWEVINEDEVLLRAERDDEGSGRIYTITITVTDAEGNITTEDLTVTVPHHVRPPVVSSSKISAGGEKEQQRQKLFTIRAVPNPATDRFNIIISSSLAETSQLRVRDDLGRLLESSNLLQGTRLITIGRNYPPGIYFVEVQQGERREILKLIKSGK